jgi:hypothetical protein
MICFLSLDQEDVKIISYTAHLNEAKSYMEISENPIKPEKPASPAARISAKLLL